MATWADQYWEGRIESGLPRRERRSGPYSTYVPDLLVGRLLRIDGDLAQSLDRAERAIRNLQVHEGAESLVGIARFLLRSEAIASSQIEGIAPSARQVALAELGREEPVRGTSEGARLVANNIALVRQASAALADADRVSAHDIESLHSALMPDEHSGIRTTQNWIGGSRYHPLGADFVPPEPSRVRALMDDLAAYLTASPHAPLVHAALVHAQFETIHPFTDGNGRVGRSLIHTVLTRRGLTRAAVLPVSLVLSTLRDDYVAGLTSFRHSGDADSPESQRSLARWLHMFADASLIATEKAAELATEIAALRAEWSEALNTHRTENGSTRAPRSNSAAMRLLALLPEAPVVTVRSTAMMLDISRQAAAGALDDLHAAGILTKRSIDSGAVAFLAAGVLDLLDHTERQLASTQFDTRAAEPNRAVPARRD